MTGEDSYPSNASARNEWILAKRPARHKVDLFQPHNALLELERSECGLVVTVATLFLTNRECPWRCLMCDLWKTTVEQKVPAQAIPIQIDEGFKRLGRKPWDSDGPSAEFFPPAGMTFANGARIATQVKLYNGGSFFDPQAIPPEDYREIAKRVCRFERVIVECHPAFVGDACLRFNHLLVEEAGRSNLTSHGPQLEVAMGLETADPTVLERLNKRMTLEMFSRAAAFLQRHRIALRVFILVKPPFHNEVEAVFWSKRSLDFAFDSDATVASLIPTRPGNGALEALEKTGHFAPPRLGTLETALDYGLQRRRGRVFADLWDLEKFSDCPACFEERRARLLRCNLEQVLQPPISCSSCGARIGFSDTETQ